MVPIREREEATSLPTHLPLLLVEIPTRVHRSVLESDGHGLPCIRYLQ